VNARIPPPSSIWPTLHLFSVTDDDEDDEELLALEADRVKDANDLPGERLNVS
jgi:hypothetical protein